MELDTCGLTVTATARVARSSLLARHLDHLRRGIYRHDLDTASGKTQSVFTSAAPQLENTLWGVERLLESRPDKRAQRFPDGGLSERCVVPRRQFVKRCHAQPLLLTSGGIQGSYAPESLDSQSYPLG